MGKKADFICNNCGYKVFTSEYGGGFAFGSSSYSCFACKNVTEITEWTMEVSTNDLFVDDIIEEGTKIDYEIKCRNCGNADPNTLIRWQHDSTNIKNNNKPCPVCKEQMIRDPKSWRFILLD